MVALLTSDPVYRLPHTPGAVIARRSRPRHLHAVFTPSAVPPGTDAGQSERRDAMVAPRALEGRVFAIPTAELLAFFMVLGVAILLVVSFRTVQGPPADTTWKSLATVSASAPASAGEIVIAVQPGDTLWGIAGVIAPELDRREVVQRLVDRNGGSAIWAGQDLIVPASVANL